MVMTRRRKVVAMGADGGMGGWGECVKECVSVCKVCKECVRVCKYVKECVSM